MKFDVIYEKVSYYNIRQRKPASIQYDGSDYREILGSDIQNEVDNQKIDFETMSLIMKKKGTRGMKSGFIKFKTGIEKTVDVISVVLLSMIFILGLAQVFWRWVLKDPIIWSEELIQLTYVWICYLGWVIAEKKDSHIRITAFMNMCSKKVQKWLQAISHVISIIFSVIMIYYGIELTMIGAKRTAVSIPLNFSIVYVIAPICNLIIIAYEIAELIECFKVGPRDYKEKGGDEE